MPLPPPFPWLPFFIAPKMWRLCLIRETAVAATAAVAGLLLETIPLGVPLQDLVSGFSDLQVLVISGR